MTQQKIKIGLVVSGASGSILALQALRLLKELSVDNPGLSSHVIITDGGKQTAALELTKPEQDELCALAGQVWNDHDLTAPMASGSNPLDGLIIVPCSVRSMSAIAYGQTDRLSTRAADVMLKERRPLVLAVRETPFHLGHLRSMQQITEMGGIIAPPLPALYLQPQSIEEMTRQSAARLLSLLPLQLGAYVSRWEPPDVE